MHLNNLRIIKFTVSILDMLSLALILYFIITLSTHKYLDTSSKVIAALFVAF
jgi:hypothetical protein